MARRNDKPGYRYGLILNQEKYPVKVHRAKAIVTLVKEDRMRVLEAQCGAGVNQSTYDPSDRRNRIEIQTRLLDGERTVYCERCWR